MKADKLQELLDERWPLENNQSESDRLYKMKRQAFTEGYNAAVAQIRIENPTLTLTQAEHFAAKKF